jgi:hypothetical protein
VLLKLNLQEARQLCRGLVLRNWVHLFDGDGEGVRQALHGPGLELLVLRIDVKVGHPQCQVSRDVQVTFDERPVDR